MKLKNFFFLLVCCSLYAKAEQPTVDLPDAQPLLSVLHTPGFPTIKNIYQFCGNRFYTHIVNRDGFPENIKVDTATFHGLYQKNPGQSGYYCVGGILSKWHSGISPAQVQAGWTNDPQGLYYYYNNNSSRAIAYTLSNYCTYGFKDNSDACIPQNSGCLSVDKHGNCVNPISYLALDSSCSAGGKLSMAINNKPQTLTPAVPTKANPASFDYEQLIDPAGKLASITGSYQYKNATQSCVTTFNQLAQFSSSQNPELLICSSANTHCSSLSSQVVISVNATTPACQQWPSPAYINVAPGYVAGEGVVYKDVSSSQYTVDPKQKTITVNLADMPAGHDWSWLYVGISECNCSHVNVQFPAPGNSATAVIDCPAAPPPPPPPPSCPCGNRLPDGTCPSCPHPGTMST